MKLGEYRLTRLADGFFRLVRQKRAVLAGVGVLPELARLGVSTATGPQLHVEVRRLDVDIPKLSGGVTCTLAFDVLVRYEDGTQTVDGSRLVGLSLMGTVVFN